MLFCGCSDIGEFASDIITDGNDVIHVGGLSTDEMGVRQAATRAAGGEETNAEEILWLKEPLISGLDITYGSLKNGVEQNKHVAILNLLTNDDGTIKYSTYTEDNVEKKLAEYSFLYKTTEGTGTNAVTKDTPAKWYDNGPHFFEGVYVPDELRNSNTATKPADLTTDQSGNNYTYLSRYLAMPANHHISATISRIKLPFKHRLSRVLAYVLIDPDMGDGITIRGYKKDAEGHPQQDAEGNDVEDPATSDIRFCKVKVLSGVDEQTNGELTPRWTSEAVRKVIPHYVGENGGIDKDGKIIPGTTADGTGTEFIMYHHKKRDEYIAPSNEKYAAIAEAYASNGETSGYEKIVYKNAPCYDLIVEPSYSDKEHVMYDEEGYYKDDGSIDENKIGQLANIQNMIEFEVTLSNGLHYTKEFHFNDLDANWQTAVYLRISKESIDYDNSGATLWNNTVHEDGWYGVNNQNGNVLSDAGSSWQRAFHIGTVNPDITDGSNYKEDKEDDYNPNKNGQYLSHDSWVKAFAQAVEGGAHHGDYFVLDGDITIDATMLPDNFVFTGHLDGKGHTITLTNTGSPSYKPATDLTQQLYTKNGTSYSQYTVPNPLYTRTLATYSDDEIVKINGKYYVKDTVTDNGDGTYTVKDDSVEKNVGDVKEPEQYEYTILTSPTLTNILNDELYTDQNGTRFQNPIALYVFSHTSHDYLFAGLNGDYEASVGVANIHKENNILVPVKGYRAELLNIIFGCTPFADGATITGYINNCKLAGGTSVDKNPGIPEY